MSKAAPKKRPANGEAAALGAKKKIKTADVSERTPVLLPTGNLSEPTFVCTCTGGVAEGQGFG